MAIQWAGNNIVCLQADRVNLPTNVPVNTKAWATNTGRIFKYNGVSWVTNNVKAGYAYIIFEDTEVAKVYCQDSNGEVVSEGSTSSNPHGPMQYALDNGEAKKIYFAESAHTLPAAPANNRYLLMEHFDTRIECDPGCEFFVANGFTGDFVEFYGDARRCLWDGGLISENGTPVRAWDMFYFHGTDITSGQVGNRIQNVYGRSGARAFHFLTEGSDPNKFWINGNIFQNNNFYSFKKAFIEFENTTATPSSIARNDFLSNLMQCASITENGILNISGRANTFQNQRVWDFIDPTGTGFSSNIVADAEDTQILGGIMTVTHFEDLGIDTLILDPWTIKIPAKYASTVPFGNITIAGFDFRRLLTSPSVRINGGYIGQGSTATSYGSYNGKVTNIAATAGSVPTFDTDGVSHLWNVPATGGTLRGNRLNAALTRRDFNPYYEAKIKVDSISDIRLAAGFIQLSNVDPTAGAEPAASIACALAWLDNNGVTWKIRHNTSTATSTSTNTGINAVAGVNIIKIFLCSALPSGIGQARLWYSINDSAWVAISTPIPAGTSNLQPMQWIETVGNNAKVYQIYYSHVEADK